MPSANESNVVRPIGSFDYYLENIYWNNFDMVVQYNNNSISARPDVNWIQHIVEHYGSFDTGLFIHCGNGWVERECYRHGLVRNVVGTDVSEGLLEQARTAADQMGISHKYLYLDSNISSFEGLEFDCAFNHAAFHHIAYIDRALRSLALTMKPQTYLFNYDFTGPDRNQYSWENWSAVTELNHALPKRFQSELRYPHIPTILATDPTEAIHSSLVLDVVQRYFAILELKPLGGGLAYEILFGNRRLWEEQKTSEGREALEKIISADQRWTAQDTKRSFFNFWVGVPRRMGFHSQSQLDAWTSEENTRELSAMQNGGRYAPPTALELIYNRFADTLDRWR